MFPPGVVLLEIGRWTALIQLGTVKSVDQKQADKRMGKQLTAIGWITFGVALGISSPALVLVALVVLAIVAASKAGR
jgi:hypothetical protein